MIDTRFTASNGFYVQDEWVYRPDGEAWLEADTLAAVALIEYGAHQAQAERDAALGRWRSVEHPDWVVYPGKPDESLPVRYQECVVVDERDGNRLVYGSAVTSCYSGEGKEVAREFFAAHPVPEPKPWEEAQEGEAWVLWVQEGQELPAICKGGAFITRYGDAVNAQIERGRRIWPEVSA